MELTYKELQEELRREQLTNEVSNKSIIKLLSEKKDLQEKYEAKNQELIAELKECESRIQDLETEMQSQTADVEDRIMSLEKELADKEEALREMEIKASQSLPEDTEHIHNLEEKIADLTNKLKSQERHNLVTEDVLQEKRNARGAGRKKVATPETIEMVMKLRETGVSYVKISQVLKERLGVELGRTTVGEIVRGTYEKHGLGQPEQNSANAS